MKRADIGFYTLLATTLATFLYLFAFVFFKAPLAQPEAGGIAQKIFYFHVPSAYAMYLSGVVCFVASALYLFNPKDSFNAVAEAGAEVAVTFGAVVLTSGPLWAKKAWGIYWTWDPRLTVSLLTVMIYLAIVVMRGFAGEGHAERKFAAALGVLGTFNLPIIHWAVQKWGGTHPAVITGKGGGLKHPDMQTALMIGFLAMTLLAAALLWWRAQVGIARARLRHAEERALTLD
ncbi:MAG TPA: cytochrome c biogenesis protein CcsA [Polyangiaceae bacterium]|jgi:heme exporter protein C|nr:cytochrome c biogenesis protein CcsA [Polyangiaceae bacterium]